MKSSIALRSFFKSCWSLLIAPLVLKSELSRLLMYVRTLFFLFVFFCTFFFLLVLDTTKNWFVLSQPLSIIQNTHFRKFKQWHLLFYSNINCLFCSTVLYPIRCNLKVWQTEHQLRIGDILTYMGSRTDWPSNATWGR